MCRGRAGAPAPAPAAGRNAARRNGPRGFRRRSGRDARQSPRACRSPASTHRDRSGATPSLPGSCRNRYHGRPMNDSATNDGTTEPPATEATGNWWQRLAGGLKRSSSALGAVSALVTKRKLDDATLAEIHDGLVRADLGLAIADRITAVLGEGRHDSAISPDEVKAVVAAEIEKALLPVAQPLAIEVEKKPFVILVAGVNGSGKTTTIGKLSAKLRAEGRSVMLAAGDTF